MTPAERRAARRHPWALCRRVDALASDLEPARRTAASEKALGRVLHGTRDLCFAHGARYASAPWGRLPRVLDVGGRYDAAATAHALRAQAQALATLAWRSLPAATDHEDCLTAVAGWMQALRGLRELEALAHPATLSTPAAAGECGGAP